jgi:cytochrome c oxidase assembly protein subunit 15
LARVVLYLQMMLVVTGSAVRLTGSGLGCSSWPRCTSSSLTNTPEQGIHGYIEFGNRVIVVLLEVVAVLLVLVVRRHAPQWTRLAAVQVLVVPLQAVIGGVLVLTDLNPYVLVLHFLGSFPLVYAAAVLLRRALGGERAPQPRVAQLSLAALLASSAVLVAGTLVTGTGPHAGDPKVDRMPFDPERVAQLHADVVWLLCGLVLALVLVTREPLRRWAIALLGLVLAQGALGYWQYYHSVPALSVGFHVAGATLVFTTAAWLQLSARPVSPSPRGSASTR